MCLIKVDIHNVKVPLISGHVLMMKPTVLEADLQIFAVRK